MSARRIFTCIPLILVLFCVSSFAKYSGGTGSGNDPYLIATPEDLNSIGLDPCDWNKRFLMTADINMAGYFCNTAVIAWDIDNSNDFHDGNIFTGIFNGDGHTIFSLTIDDEGAGNDYLGLFGKAGEGGVIKNIRMVDVNINSAGDFIGGLCGANYYMHYSGAYIENCSSSGSVNGDDYVGGLCGSNGISAYQMGGLIVNCSSSVSVNGDDYVGGLCGYSSLSGISNCHTSGSVTGSLFVGGLCGQNEQDGFDDCHSSGSVNGGNNSGYIGGLCGSNFLGSISDCSSSGSVNVGDDSEYVGGLCGDNFCGDIDNCLATGSVTGGGGSERLGGLCGQNGGRTTNCYSRGSVTGGSNSRYLGGLCGQNFLISTSYCYSTGSVTGGAGSDYLGGLCGDNDDGVISDCYFLEGAGPDNGLGSPLTDTQMMQQVSFVGWDFATPIWRICEWVHYPILYWEEYSCEKYSGGTGAPNDPYLIATPNDLYELRIGGGDSHFKMIDDINMAGFYDSHPLFIISGGFAGVFDGNGHSISNFCGTEGLFEMTVNESSVVKNLTMIDVNMVGNQPGGLVGTNNGVIINCSVSGNVTGGYCVGGLAGWSIGVVEDSSANCIVYGDEAVGGLVGMNKGDVLRCFTCGTVTGERSVGGLTGDNNPGNTISDSYSICYVNGHQNIGGLIGQNYGDIINCYSFGGVDANDSAGGLVGENRGIIATSFADANVTVSENAAGGLCGANHDAEITNSYSRGVVSGDFQIGGLVGLNNSSTIADCFSTTFVNGITTPGGFCGKNMFSNVFNSFWDIETSGLTDGDGGPAGTDPNITGLPTAQMKMRSTFADAGWDMVNVWDIGENQTYPFLRTHLPSDINKDGETNLYDLAILALNWME